jgi:hypothetical protein
MANKSGLNMLEIQLQIEGSIVQQVGFGYSNIYPTRYNVTQFVFFCKLLDMFHQEPQ